MFGKGDGKTFAERPDMPIVIACACGKRLKAPDHLAGKRVKCPACGQMIAVKAAPASASPAKPVADADKIKITCACGAVLRAPKRLLGTDVKCPKCSKPVRVEEDEEDAFAPPAPAAPPPAAGALGADAAPPYEPDEEEADQGFEKPRCKACKEEMNFGDVICLKCGTNQATGEKIEAFEGEAEPEDPSHQAGAPPKALIAGVVAAVVVAFAAIAYFQFLRPGDDEASAIQEQADAPDQRPRERADRAAREPAPAPAPAPADEGEAEVVQPDRVFGDDSEWALERYVYAPRRTDDRMALTNANRAVEMFREAEGRAPRSLEEVEEKGYGPLASPRGDDVELALHPQSGEVVLIRRR